MERIVCSDTHDLSHPQHGRKAKEKPTRYDRMMARRRPKRGQPASKGHQEAKRWRAKKVVRDHNAIAVENFRPKFLARTSTARKAANAAIGAAEQALLEMVRKHRRDVRLAHPAHTTMDCASCGARTKHAPPVGTPNCCRSAPTPAPRAEPPVPGTRTPPA